MTPQEAATLSLQLNANDRLTMLLGATAIQNELLRWMTKEGKQYILRSSYEAALIEKIDEVIGEIKANGISNLILKVMADKA